MRLPLINRLKIYNLNTFRLDFIASISVFILLVPQAMAYAVLAGLPAVYGLYGAIVPLMIYPFFSSSAYLSIGPVALMSMILLSGVSVFSTPGSPEYIDLILLTSFMSGIIQIVFAFLKLGNLSNLISRPVMFGFMVAAACIIVIGQLPVLLGIELPRINFLPKLLLSLIQNFTSLNVIALSLGLIALLLLILLPRLNHKLPSALIVVVLSSLMVYGLNLEQHDIGLIGEVPSGFPKMYLGFFNWDHIMLLIPEAFIVSIIGFIGSYSIASDLARDNKLEPIEPQRELLGLGVAKLIGSFFLAMPSTGSFTRSFVNKNNGAQSGVSSIITAILVVLLLLWFNSAFRYLAQPILAAVVISSVLSLFDVKEMKKLFLTDRRDFISFLITVLLTLILGIVNGILLGIGWSLISIVMRATKPHYAILGKLPGTNTYRSLTRYPEAESHEENLIFRYDQDIFFGNSDHFFQSMLYEIEQRPNIKRVIFQATSLNKPDATAIEKIRDILEYCHDRDLRFIITDLSGPPRDLFHKTGIFELIGSENFHLSIGHATESIALNEEEERENLSNYYSQQVNSGKKKGFFKF